MPIQNSPQLIDFHPRPTEMRDEVLSGLTKAQKELSPKFFYDAEGSHLFEEITRLPEYYLTRTEALIMADSVAEIAQLVGPKAAVIEFGSGAGDKIRVLLNHLQSALAFVPIEISRDHLMASARALATQYPQLNIIAVCADFTQPFDLPPISGSRRNLVFFPGSTIGNFPPEQAVSLLKIMNHAAGKDGALLIGADLVKDKQVLEAAYNDSAGITAKFNLNLLRHINRVLQTDFDLTRFQHQAVYNAADQRIEMYLVSEQEHTVRVGDQLIRFERGERILTEFAYKYELDSFARLASRAGLRVDRVWTDSRQHFSVQYLLRDPTVAPGG